MTVRKGPPKGSKKPPKLLVVMRRVWREKKGAEGGTAEEQRLREIRDKDPAKFMADMNKLESEFRTRKDRALAGQEEARRERQEDAGTDRVVELMDQLLSEWEGQDAAAGSR
jgi:hypothetical protein